MQFNWDALAFCILVLNECRLSWGLGISEFGCLVEEYKLCTFLSENRDILNAYGICGIVLEVAGYIKRQGGPDFNGVS